MTTDHYLYVISSRDEGPCKIGISSDPSARLKQLQTGHPEKLVLRYVEPVEPARVKIYETLIHRHMSYMRSHGEWFKLTVQEAILQVQWTIIHYSDVDDLEKQVRRRR